MVRLYIVLKRQRGERAHGLFSKRKEVWHGWIIKAQTETGAGVLTDLNQRASKTRVKRLNRGMTCSDSQYRKISEVLKEGKG